jgi:hypothetical protein
VILFVCALLIAVSGAHAGDSQSAEAAKEPALTFEKPVDGFSGTYATQEELFDALEASIGSGDPELLRGMAVNQAEFRDVVWPTLDIAKRPKSNFTWEFVWSQHETKHEKCLLRTSHDYAGQRFDIVAVSFNGRTTDHGTFKIHRDSEVEIVRPDGTQERVSLFGSLLETVDGRYKIYSFIND